MNNSITYRPEVDGLRALAIILVVLYHATPSLVPFGFIGVDVFFVISGFLIASIITKEMDLGRFSFIGFYERRIARLFPALQSVFAIVIVLSIIILNKNEIENILLHTIFSTLFSENILLIRQVGYFDQLAETKPLLHLWSLAVEEQFYLVWPLVLLLVSLLSPKRRSFAIVTLGIASFVLAIYYARNNPQIGFYMPLTRVFEFAVGTVCALNPRYRMGSLAALISITVGTVVSARVTPQTPWPGWHTLAICLLAASLIIQKNHHVLRILRSRPLVFVGLISYPLYLLHWPLLSFLYIAFDGNPTLTARLITVFVAIALSTAVYLFIEKPIRLSVHSDPSAKQKYARRLLSISVVLVLLSSLVLAMNIIPDGFNVNSDIRPATKPEVYAAKSCRDRVGFDAPYCLTSSEGRSPDVALIGDSHANHLFAGLNDYVMSRGLELINVGACLPAYNVRLFQLGTKDSCLELSNKMLDYVLNEKSIKWVVVSNRMAYWMSGFPFRHFVVPKNEYVVEDSQGRRDRERILHDGLSSVLKKMKAAGKHVVFVTQVPELDFSPERCTRSLFSDRCWIERDDYIARQKAYRGVIEELSKEHSFDVVETGDLFCDKDRCNAVKNGQLLYTDDNHIGVEASMLLKPLYNFLPTGE